MSTPFNVRSMAAQAGIQTTGGFAVIAECVTLEELERFAALVASAAKAEENEACAKVCDDEDVAPTDDAVGVQQCIATAIRARKENT